jgi:hypothetical protein
MDGILFIRQLKPPKQARAGRPLWVKSDSRALQVDVRFTLESGHVRCTSSCLLWANSGHHAPSREWIANAGLTCCPSDLAPVQLTFVEQGLPDLIRQVALTCFHAVT